MKKPILTLLLILAAFPAVVFSADLSTWPATFQNNSLITPSMLNELRDSVNSKADRSEVAFGAWAESTSYAQYDIVANMGVLYACTVAHASTVLNEPGIGGVWETVWSVATGTADADLDAIATLSTLPWGRDLLTLSDASAPRIALGLVIGTDVLSPTGDGSGLQNITVVETDPEFTAKEAGYDGHLIDTAQHIQSRPDGYWGLTYPCNTVPFIDAPAEGECKKYLGSDCSTMMLWCYGEDAKPLGTGATAAAWATITGTPSDSAALTDYINSLISARLGSAGFDTTPNAFTFVDQTGVALNTLIYSAGITIAGTDTATSITASGDSDCAYSINSADAGAFTTASGTAITTDVIRARVRSSTAYSTAADCQITIGGVSDTFSATTLANAAEATQNRVPTADYDSVWDPSTGTDIYPLLSDSDDATYAYRQNSVADQWYTFPSFSITSTSIEQVIVRMRCREVGGDTTARARLYLNSTEWFGSDRALSTSWADYTNYWVNSPATSLPWTEAEVESMNRFSVEGRSIVAGEEIQCSEVSIEVVYE